MQKIKTKTQACAPKKIKLTCRRISGQGRVAPCRTSVSKEATLNSDQIKPGLKFILGALINRDVKVVIETQTVPEVVNIEHEPDGTGKMGPNHDLILLTLPREVARGRPIEVMNNRGAYII